ncbi:DHA2 family efflux MFS transporter permease subunit [Sphingorhabdus sp. 109]|uniref:DHA2 family efflux MFS transporter permease subunit n=1 Tax=Sphingorhabdus sp. 109 TaxID=2653173 RepID=UPI0012F046FC|nr:DHA2 family efflux MFS transporter permease subunit [Sphingorhabdus sp. 109]VWX57111.1 Multidrug resistance protein B [Sphingorhabdus sp. 109]
MNTQDPDVAALPVDNRVLLTIAVMLGNIMQILDSTIANVALPHMQSGLGATLDTVTWVLTSYILASAVAIPITGWVADRIGSRKLFLLSIAGFTLSSFLCATASNLEMLVFYRVMQGLSGAFVMPLSQTVMLDINPPKNHPRAMAIWGMGVMIAPITGPVIGGYLTENYSWEWIFLINVPLGIIAFIMLWTLLPSRPVTRRKFDLLGFALFAGFMASFQLMLDRGNGEDWFESWEIIIEFGIAAAALWMFSIHMVSAKNPFLSRDLFRDRNLVTAMLLMMVAGVSMFSTMALLPPMLQNIYHYTPVDAGLILAPRGIGVFMGMAIGSRLATRIDARFVVAVGMALASYSAWMMTGWSLDMNRWPVIISGIVQGLGMGGLFVTMNILGFSTLSPALRTDGASLLNLSRTIGASVGIAVFVGLLGRNWQTSHADLAGHVTEAQLSPVSPTSINRLGQYGEQAMMVIDGEVNRQALMIAYLGDFWLMAVVTALCVPLVFLMKKPQRIKLDSTEAASAAH